jgi:16S rRNA processing protein RimM
VGVPHGLDGSFLVAEPNPLLLPAGGQVWIDGVPRTIERRAGHDRRLILRLDGCATREDAEALRGSLLHVARDGAPPLEEDEWWAEELEGCAVVDGQRAVGVVRRLLALPSCEVLEVERADGSGDLLVPLVGDAVRTVDVAARSIDIDLAFLGEMPGGVLGGGSGEGPGEGSGEGSGEGPGGSSGAGSGEG